MQTGGICGSGGWGCFYKNAIEAGAGAFGQGTANPVSGAGDGKRADRISVENYGVVDENNPSSLHSLKQREIAYEAELADAKKNDPAKYYRMMSDRAEAITKSLNQLEEAALAGGKAGTVTYKGVPISFDSETKAMTIGNTGSGDVINVGQISNGYSLSFSRDSIDAITQMLDLFAPGDINKIMEAISKDNIKRNMEQENEEMKDQVVQTAEEAASEADADADADRMASKAKEEAAAHSLDNMLDGLLKNRDKSTEGSSGMGSEDSGNGEEEEDSITSEIVVNSDGTRNLIITKKIGDQELITKMPLSPLPEHDEHHRQKGAEAYEEQLFSGLGVMPLAE